VADVFDLFGVAEGNPEATRALEALAQAVQALQGDAEGFSLEPRLGQVVDAVEDLLAATGHPGASLAAFQWGLYERSGRRKSKIRDARLRADHLYREELERIRGGWEGPVIITEQTHLSWLKPDLPKSHDG